MADDGARKYPVPKREDLAPLMVCKSIIQYFLANARVTLGFFRVLEVGEPPPHLQRRRFLGMAAVIVEGGLTGAGTRFSATIVDKA